MAYVAPAAVETDEDKKKKDPLAPTTVGGGEIAPAPISDKPVQAVGSTAGNDPATINKLQELQGSASQDLANKLAEYLRTSGRAKFEEVKNPLLGSFGESVKAGGGLETFGEADKALIARARANPYAFSTNQNDLEQWNKLFGAQYTGPKSLASADLAQLTAAERAQLDRLNQLGTSSGQLQLLTEYLQQQGQNVPSRQALNYNRALLGQADAADILRSQKGALTQEFSGLDEAAAQAAMNLIGSRAENVEAARKATREATSGAFGDIRSRLSAAAAAETPQVQEKMKRLEAVLASGGPIDNDMMRDLGLTQAEMNRLRALQTQAESLTPEAASLYSSFRLNDPTMAATPQAFATRDDLANWQALNQLAQTEDQWLSGAKGSGGPDYFTDVNTNQLINQAQDLVNRYAREREAQSGIISSYGSQLANAGQSKYQVMQGAIANAQSARQAIIDEAAAARAANPAGYDPTPFLQRYQNAENQLNSLLNQMQGMATYVPPPPPPPSGGGCFAAGVEVYMKDGTWKAVDQLELGDDTYCGEVVGWGKVYNPNMWTYRGMTVSGTHAFFDEGRWTETENLPDAKRLEGEQVVYPVVIKNTHLMITRAPLDVTGRSGELHLSADFEEVFNGDDFSREERLQQLRADTWRNKFLRGGMDKLLTKRVDQAVEHVELARF